MKRLTGISEITDFYMPIKMQESCGESACKEVCEQYEGDGCKGCPVQECITRLAEYEDIVENKLECIKEMLENEDYSREEIIREVEITIDSL